MKGSVIVPAFNGEEYLAGTLESNCDQSDPDVEIVAIHDGSTDGTPEWLGSYKHRKLPLNEDQR